MQDTVSLMLLAVSSDTGLSVCRRYSESIPGSLLITFSTGSLLNPTGAMWMCISAPHGASVPYHIRDIPRRHAYLPFTHDGKIV